MPLQFPKFNQLDAAGAIAQGNRNALAEAQLMGAAQQQQQRNILAPIQQEKAQLGVDAAKMSNELQGLKYIAGTAPRISDQATYDAALFDWEEKGLVKPGELPPQYSADIVNRLMGGAAEKLKIGSYNPRDYTPKSWDSFLKSKDPSGLVRYETSKEERIAGDPDLAGRIETTQASIFGAKSGAKEKAKLTVQSAMLPRIRASIKQAEIEAKDRGEALTKLGRAKASLPGLQEVVKKLGSLAEIGTYTITGRGFDMMVKELGFGATKGSTARVKMTAIVNNQVLPLLRDTFGAAFTVAEGESLRATLLDVNATPEQKKATLSAFIEQKVRDIETQEREVGGAQPQQAPQGQTPQQFPPQNNQGWALHKDAQGKQAYVGPNGEIEEVR